jgi:hypothetical protein
MPSNAYTRNLLANRAFKEMIRKRKGFVGKGQGNSNKWDSVDKYPLPKQYNPGTRSGKSKVPPHWGRRA